CHLFFLRCYDAPPDLPSFPTRRSSDLATVGACCATAGACCANAGAAASSSRAMQARVALLIIFHSRCPRRRRRGCAGRPTLHQRSEEHTSELQSLRHLVCRLLLEKKKK